MTDVRNLKIINRLEQLVSKVPSALAHFGGKGLQFQHLQHWRVTSRPRRVRGAQWQPAGPRPWGLLVTVSP